MQRVGDDLGENGVRLVVQPYVRPDDFLAVTGPLRERIKERFDAEGIRFAIPAREVTMHPAAPEPAARS